MIWCFLIAAFFTLLAIFEGRLDALLKECDESISDEAISDERIEAWRRELDDEWEMRR